MILTCPQCATRYQADEAKFAPEGRNVRCAKCGHVWHQSAPQAESDSVPEIPAEAAAEDDAAPAPRAEDRPARAAGAKPAWRAHPGLGHLGLGLGWAALIAVVLGAGWGAAAYRQSIAGVWPQSASVYARLGLKTGTLGLEFSGVTYRTLKQNGQPVLAVSGTLKNAGARELAVPEVRVTLTDADKNELYHWTFMPDVMTLKAGQSASFETHLTSPPAAARHLELRLARAGE